MAQITAKDVQALRRATGAGMMDAKRALEEAGGDVEAAKRILRERGLAKAESRAERDNADGVVAIGTAEGAAAIVELRCETDFVAKNPEFRGLAQEAADLVAAKGPEAVEELRDRLDDLRVKLKENIELGRVVRIEAQPGDRLDTYLHVQADRGVNAVIVETTGDVDPVVAHDIAMHIAFARPAYLTRDEVPAEEVEAERAVLEAQTRNEGKPEAAIPKIVEGKLAGWYRDRVLLDQKFVKDEKRTVADLLGGGRIIRFAQVVVGG